THGDEVRHRTFGAGDELLGGRLGGGPIAGLPAVLGVMGMGPAAQLCEPEAFRRHTGTLAAAVGGGELAAQSVQVRLVAVATRDRGNSEALGEPDTAVEVGDTGDVTEGVAGRPGRD